MRLCRPVRGPGRGAATPARLPSDIGCLHTQEKQALIGLKDKGTWHSQSAVKSLFQRGGGHHGVCRSVVLQGRTALHRNSCFLKTWCHWLVFSFIYFIIYADHWACPLCLYTILFLFFILFLMNSPVKTQPPIVCSPGYWCCQSCSFLIPLLVWDNDWLYIIKLFCLILVSGDLTSLASESFVKKVFLDSLTHFKWVSQKL